MITRRHVLQTALSTPLFFVNSSHAELLSEVPVENLKPGQWVWYPERSPYGPVAVIVSLSDQLAFVFRNGIRIGVTTVSTGKEGFETPIGVFTVLIKERMHRSHKYHNAAMPDSQFFFGGAALHAGGLPGYPSSHGCVHLPKPFADRLFDVTHNGTPVIVTDARASIGPLSHAGLVLSNNDLKQIETLVGHVQSKKLPKDVKGNSGAFSILASGADRRIYGLQDGKIIVDEPITIKRKWPLGNHVYLLNGFNKQRTDFEWVAIGLGENAEPSSKQQKELAETMRLVIPPKAYNQIAKHLHPGSAFMLTDLPAHPATRTNGDFLIMRDTGRG